MSWVRIHDGAMTHPKIVGLPDRAFRLWIWGLSYCQQHLTDGVIPSKALGAGLARIAAMLILARLWEVQEENSYRVHDYLDWNDSRAVVSARRAAAEAQKLATRNVARERLQRWRDMKRLRNATETQSETHVKRDGNAVGNALETLLTKPNQTTDLFVKEPQTDRARVRVSLVTDKALGDTAASFLERYRALYTELRHGARLKILTGNLDFSRACELLQTWDGAYLERLARVFLTTDEDWISRTDRGFAVFAAKASWCDDRLKAAEHGAT